MNRSTLLERLPRPKGKEQLIVRYQDVADIKREILDAHEAFAGDYDRIADRFGQGSTEKRLYDYCRKYLDYCVETEQDQQTTSPGILLQRGHCDCKGYASFIAGNLDALCRQGRSCNWTYRFAEYPESEKTGTWHVFVVVKNSDGSETWVDPVLDGFNKRHPSPIRYEDQKPVTMLTRVSGPAPILDPCCEEDPFSIYGYSNQRIGFSAQVSQLRDAFNQYLQDLLNGVNQTISTGQPNGYSASVISTAAAGGDPTAQEVLAGVQGLQSLAASFTGVGSPLTRVLAAVLSLNPGELINAMFNGRTFQSDQYAGALFWKRLVQGQDTQSEDDVTDQEVIPAMEWWMMKLGVYIPGREAILALKQSADAYLAYAGNDNYITRDRQRVQDAVNTIQSWPHAFFFTMPAIGPFGGDTRAGGPLGAWRNVPGVFDNPLTKAFQQRMAAQQAQAQQTGQGQPGAGLLNNLKTSPVLLVLLAAAGLYLLYKITD